MPRSKTKAPASDRMPSPAPSHESQRETNVMVLSEGLDTSAWFPFFILAFASLAACFAVVAWSLPSVQAGDYRYLPVTLAGVVGMVLSPVIGHFLSTCVLAFTDSIGRSLLSPLAPAEGEGKDDAGVARALVLVLAVLLGVVAWLVMEVRGLRAEAATLRREIAYVALRDAAAHEGTGKGWFA